MIPLFQCECDEPEGKIIRTVYQAEFSRGLLLNLWEKQKKYRTLMGKEVLTFDEFVDFFVKCYPDGTLESRGLCYIIDDCVGIFWLSNICWPLGAEVHYTFFDGRHNGRLNLTRRALKYAFQTYCFARLYVRVALYAKLPIRFVESVGFKREGRLRKCILYRDRYYDANAYSILKEEIDYEQW